jgi:predicted  nucleic acid-binding Zn-ribbon protein
MTRPPYDEAFQSLFDAANRILEATERDEATARSAICALEQTRQRVEAQLGAISSKVTGAIEQSAGTTATETARLLQERFLDADDAAERAKDRYEQAAKWLGWKTCGFAVLLQMAIIGGVWLLVTQTIPSQAELDTRRASIEQLEEQASALRVQKTDLEHQVTVLNRKVVVLERRGGGLQLSTCSSTDEQDHVCFRTNEDDQALPYVVAGKTYRIPSGY